MNQLWLQQKELGKDFYDVLNTGGEKVLKQIIMNLLREKGVNQLTLSSPVGF